jgi:hypothetical protein
MNKLQLPELAASAIAQLEDAVVPENTPRIPTARKSKYVPRVSASRPSTRPATRERNQLVVGEVDAAGLYKKLALIVPIRENIEEFNDTRHKNIMNAVSSCKSFNGAPAVSLSRKPVSVNHGSSSNNLQLKFLIGLKKDKILTLADWLELQQYENTEKYDRDAFSAKSFMQSYITKNNMKEIMEREEEERKEQAKEKKLKSVRRSVLAKYQVAPSTPTNEKEDVAVMVVPSAVSLKSMRGNDKSLIRGLLTKGKKSRPQSIAASKANSAHTSTTSIYAAPQSHQLVPNTPNTQSRRDSASAGMSRRASIVQRDAAELLEQMAIDRYEKRQTLLILKMSKLFRTSDDLTFLARYFKDYKAFSTVSPSMMSHLCTIMTSVEYEAEQTVFKQGDVGEDWFIIMVRVFNT